MGCFSWMYSDNTDKNITINGDRFTLLFPDGRRWTDDMYDGYGHITNPDNKSEVDVYALLAVWNRKLIVETISKEVALEQRFVDIDERVADDFYDLTIDDDVFVTKVENGDEHYTEVLRLIGITADCTDTKRKTGFKPLKFVEDDGLSYDDVDASADDPNQGGILEEADDFIGCCAYCGEEIHSDDYYVEDDYGNIYCCDSCRAQCEPDEEDDFDEDSCESNYYDED